MSLTQPALRWSSKPKFVDLNHSSGRGGGDEAVHHMIFLPKISNINTHWFYNMMLMTKQALMWTSELKTELKHSSLGRGVNDAAVGHVIL